jgi:hypothetical protein
MLADIFVQFGVCDTEVPRQSWIRAHQTSEVYSSLGNSTS